MKWHLLVLLLSFSATALACNVNEDVFFRREVIDIFIWICLIGLEKQNYLEVYTDFCVVLFFFSLPESGSLLQLMFDGKYEAIFSNSAVQNVFSASSVTEENIDTYLEKQILAYLDCSAEVDNVERWKLLFIIWKSDRGYVWFLQKAF